MIRKILSLGLLIGLTSVAAHAQDFLLKADTIKRETSGQMPPAGSSWDNYCEKLFNYAFNKTTAPLPMTYQIVYKTLPIGWFIRGFCDNQTCRFQDDPAIASQTETAVMNVPVGDSCLLEPWVAVPTDADNGVGVIRVRIKTANTTDTATYIINKGTSGVSTIAIKDKRVAIYPNPATNDLTIFTDKSLNASRVEILNIAGASQFAKAIGGVEAINMDIRALATGTYLVRVTDNNGAVITTRKFSKK
ncbi:T9SS type A sorting domain-containing protein [Taibaiella koreensis]|uniref:T9SS type A sorting domain-containing protein n=1 Tax=Taibaiella koreensis TaxID=1268548 RepID=UPI000E599229|nr:T9SS type A sorting domain-containing protein [Taibaiella koreensis]